MASTNKTPQLGLNQWAAGDPVLREDFNGDNAKIDEGVALAQDYMRVGAFVGDGIPHREMTVGFHPRFVILSGVDGEARPVIIFINEINYIDVHSAFSLSNICSNTTLKLSNTGFWINDISYANHQGKNGYYIAFR